MQQATLPDSIVAAMQAAIDQEFEKSARLRKIIPEVHMPCARYGVVVPDFLIAGEKDNCKHIGASTARTVPPVRLSVELQFETPQLEDECLARDLARSAARLLARAEDQVLAYGYNLGHAGNLALPAPARIAGNQTPEGLFEHTAPPATPPSQKKIRKKLTVTVPPRPQIRSALAAAVAELDAAGQYQPYAAALPPAAWRDYVSLTEKQRREAIGTLGDGAAAPVGTAPPTYLNAYAAVFTTDPARLDLVRVQEPTLTMRGFTACDGHPRYIIEEQFLLRIKQEDAIAVLVRDTSGTTTQPCNLSDLLSCLCEGDGLNPRLQSALQACLKKNTTPAKGESPGGESTGDKGPSGGGDKGPSGGGDKGPSGGGDKGPSGGGGSNGADSVHGQTPAPTSEDR